MPESNQHRALHADELNVLEQLVGRVLDEADAELLRDLDESLREARSILDLIWADQQTWRYLKRKGYSDLLEVWFERERTHTELCWLWEKDE